MSGLPPLPLKNVATLETSAVWAALAEAHGHLAELKGLCESLPNEGILLDTLGIQEAKDSSEIENIITTHHELYAQDDAAASPAAKEVRHYVSALRVGSEAVRASGLIRLETVLAVQAELEQNRAGLRKLPGTVLKNETTGRIIYEPPQNAAVVASLMGNLIDFLHAEDGLDPLLRMAISHHQFESIHPFSDGNGRTGRILNLLVLQREGLLDLPVLYLSRYITTTKPEYYRLLQVVRDEERWDEWCLYVLRGVAVTSRSAIGLVRAFRDLMLRVKHGLREQLPKLYSQDLLNNLFSLSLHEDRARGAGAGCLAHHRDEVSQRAHRRRIRAETKTRQDELLHQRAALRPAQRREPGGRMKKKGEVPRRVSIFDFASGVAH